MKEPKGRKERVEFLIKKIGRDSIIQTVATMTDRDVKSLFDSMYPLYKNQEDYKIPELKLPECVVCGSETVTHWDCSCGNAIIDETDPYLHELKQSGEYDRIRNNLSR